ncbi:GNAT family N-acetyltransferase [Luteimicrobium xylanilyticum]|uniref:GNAT family N-acetyltransferase n=1 Tax=Luteimicrobium xylanilyticum TaxID=1133546 RepID=UPI0012904498|nr:GNAT family N-acetyltransferase [Luteimicrobium xylanilyticum]
MSTTPVPAPTDAGEPASPNRDAAVLDNPAWHALRGPHARFARSHGVALAYDPEVSPFVALPDGAAPAAFDDLAALVGPGVELGLTGPATDVPDTWEVLWAGDGVQMVASDVDAGPDEEAVVLGAADVPEMLDLVERTQPGPFRPRTVELGSYLGIRREGRLVAMAGERLRPPGWTEVSAVCTDADHRGQGFAARLVRAVVHRVRERGDEAILHATATNTGAIRLYERLGFELRRPVRFVVARTPEA